MAAPIADVSKMDTENLEICVVEATVATGFEHVARAEAEEKLGAIAKECHKGRIRIECPINRVEKVIQLGCVDHCRVLLKSVPDFGFTDDQHDNLLRLRNLVGDVNWPLGLKVWKKFFSFEHPITDTPEKEMTNFGEVTIPPPRHHQMEKSGKKSKFKKWKKKRKDKNTKSNGEQMDAQENINEESKATEDVETEKEHKTIECSHTQIKKDEVKKNVDDKPDGNSTDEKDHNLNASAKDTTAHVAKKPKIRENPWNPMKPSFRVTCNRHGDNHNFDSMTAACNMGGAVYQYFGWNVKMTEFDIEVILQIEEQEVSVSIGLTKESLHHRNITHFGPTTLRSTIAYNMLRLCDIKVGDVVCDPMCGTGSIPVQCAVSWSGVFNVCGDIAKRCMTRTSDNINFVTSGQDTATKKCMPIDAVRWDTCNSPLRQHTVDVFITDLPFGLRIGSKVDNWSLYPGTLMEMARVVRPYTGRACLLTEDKKCMIKTLQSPVISKYWFRTKTLGINMGGLAAGVFVLARTKVAFTRETTPAVTPDTRDQESTENVN